MSDALASDCREALLCVARKNAKSAIVAAYLLGRLAPGSPLRADGYRAGVVSLNREKAAELWAQAEAIAHGKSGLEGLRFLKAPRAIVGPSGSVDILSADRSAGHASGFDDAICDELGLLAERHRELVAGLRSSVSARDGRFLALSIRGDAPFTGELLERRGDPGVAGTSLRRLPRAASLTIGPRGDAANPGLGSYQVPVGYMRA